jgi:hypothetical protein
MSSHSPENPWDAHDLPVPVDKSFDALMGLEQVELTPQRVVGRLVVRDDLLGSDGALHGGVYAAMSESLTSTGTFAGRRRGRHGRHRDVERDDSRQPGDGACGGGDRRPDADRRRRVAVERRDPRSARAAVWRLDRGDRRSPRAVDHAAVRFQDARQQGEQLLAVAD